ncbi:hypothetical protein V6N13_054093 [Hibiscus sabdariffa]
MSQVEKNLANKGCLEKSLGNRPISIVPVAPHHFKVVWSVGKLVGKLGESLDNFSEDEENIVPITKDDDAHLLDVDDVEAVMADASEENGLDVEDDVWNVTVARLGSGNMQLVWGYVGPQTEQPVPSYTAYEPSTNMYDVDYTAMRDREHEAHIFGSSSSSNYGELVLNAQFETKKKKLSWQLRSTALDDI